MILKPLSKFSNVIVLIILFLFNLCSFVFFHHSTRYAILSVHLHVFCFRVCVLFDMLHQVTIECICIMSLAYKLQSRWDIVTQLVKIIAFKVVIEVELMWNMSHLCMCMGMFL